MKTFSNILVAVDFSDAGMKDAKETDPDRYAAEHWEIPPLEEAV